MSSNNASVKNNSNKKGGLLKPIMIGLAVVIILFYVYGTYR